MSQRYRHDTFTRSSIDSDVPIYRYGNSPALNPTLIGQAPPRRAFADLAPGYRSLAQRPSVYPSRGIRRASTLPVRFEDETGGYESLENERFVERNPPTIPASRRSIPREVVAREAFTRREPLRHAFVDDPNSSDSDTEQRGRNRKRMVEAKIPETVVVGGREGPTGEPSISKGEEVKRVASPPPPPAPESGSSDTESIEGNVAREGITRIPTRLVNLGALTDLGYPFEDEGDTIVILKTLEPKSINEVIELSEDYNERHRGNPWERPVIDMLPRRERVIVEDNGRPLPRSQSRSHSPVRRSQLEDEGYERERRRERRGESEEFERERRRMRNYRSPRYRDHFDLDMGQGSYPFVLSRHKKPLPSQDSTLGSLSDISEKESVPLSKAPSSASQPGKYLQVLRSRYIGEGTIGGFQSASLTVSEDTLQRSWKNPQAIFKWVQFEDASMNLDRFETGSGNVVGLTENQRSAISRLFSRVRRRFDRPMESPDGSKLRQMAPSVIYEPVNASKKSESRVVTWLCLPYFLLQRYSGSLSGLQSSSHPIKTLLQRHFSLAQKGRDMQQAVCRLAGTASEHCFHIAQVWCLVLDEDVLITCSRSPILSLMGKSIGVSIESLSQDHSKDRPRRPTNVLVHNGNLLWSLPLEECQTWFAFLSHFSEYWPKKLQFATNGRIITPGSWSNLISQTSKTPIRISLEIRPSAKELRGILHSLPTTASPGEAPSSAQGASHQEIAQASSSRPTPMEDLIGKAPNQLKVSPGSKTQAAIGTQKPASPDEHLRNKQSCGNFHVLTWLNEVPTTTLSDQSGTPVPINQSDALSAGQSLTFDETSLRADLKEMDRFLKRETSFEERLIYNECPQYTRQKVYTMLKEEGKTIAVLIQKDLTRAKGYEDKVEIFNRAEALFQFFLPSEFEGRTVEKYWGAVHRLLVAISAQERDEDNNPFRPSRYVRGLDADEVLQWLTYTAGITQAFRELFAEANCKERATIELPETLQKAWLHVLMAMVFSSKEQHLALLQDQSTIVSQLLTEGMQAVIENVGQKSLLEYAVFKPWELASLVKFVLFSDVTGQSRNVSETYIEYLNHLVLAVENNPLDRGHQDKLTAFKQEIRVILATLQQQRLILIHAERVATVQKSPETSVPMIQQEAALSHWYTAQDPSYLPAERTYRYERERERSYPRDQIHRPNPSAHLGRSSPGSQIDPTDPSGVLGLLIQDSQVLVERKMRLFDELRIRAEELEEENNFKIDYNKDRQDSAIYAFTIVTIIFLPLSTVAGILGMNTKDVRNMEINQWVFWATAIPLTAIIITLCLIWAGELENFWKSFSNIWRGSKGQGRGGGPYSTLSRRTDAYSMMDTRADIERRRSRYDDDDDTDLAEHIVRTRSSGQPRMYHRRYEGIHRRHGNGYMGSGILDHHF